LKEGKSVLSCRVKKEGKKEKKNWEGKEKYNENKGIKEQYILYSCVNFV
jgi:hypothetical protein